MTRPCQFPEIPGIHGLSRGDSGDSNYSKTLSLIQLEASLLLIQLEASLLLIQLEASLLLIQLEASLLLTRLETHPCQFPEIPGIHGLSRGDDGDSNYSKTLSLNELEASLLLMQLEASLLLTRLVTRPCQFPEIPGIHGLSRGDDGDSHYSKTL